MIRRAQKQACVHGGCCRYLGPDSNGLHAVAGSARVPTGPAGEPGMWLLQRLHQPVPESWLAAVHHPGSAAPPTVRDPMRLACSRHVVTPEDEPLCAQMPQSRVQCCQRAMQTAAAKLAAAVCWQCVGLPWHALNMQAPALTDTVVPASGLHRPHPRHRKFLLPRRRCLAADWQALGAAALACCAREWIICLPACSWGLSFATVCPKGCCM